MQAIGNATLHTGDCLDVLRTMADCSVDSIVTDPPYGLSFMGKRWDYDVPSVAIWTECLRVLKPGGHLLAFAGTRTQHRMAVRIEDAGFEIRDMIAWLYGSGFPKSLDVGKALDRSAGATRQIIGDKLDRPGYHLNGHIGGEAFGHGLSSSTPETRAAAATITAPATDAARQWEGWGTALKPALEPITMARKPLIGTVAANVQAFGTGALNVDGCRIAAADGYTENAVTQGVNTAQTSYAPAVARRTFEPQPAGRWPANLIHDGSEEVLAAFPETGPGQIGGVNDPNGALGFHGGAGGSSVAGIADAAGSAARFFYCAKASREDRNDGCEHIVERPLLWSSGEANPGSFQAANTKRAASNNHPTVKPTDLMRYLCRLVTPPRGIVLDPFSGSGSTGRAAVLEGFRYIGIELNPDYQAIAAARIDAVQRQATIDFQEAT